MSLFSWFFTLWHSSASSLLLVGLVGRQLGLRVGLQVAQTATCSQWSTPSNQGLFQDGDVVIGGLFRIYNNPPALDHNFTQLSQYKSCIGLENLPLQYVYAMVFALEEINHSTTLLPGVKLGYRIHDSCAFPLWAVQAALSLAAGNSTSCNSAALPEYSAGYGEEINNSQGDEPVPLIIGGDSSVTAQILATVLGPISVSYAASCSCLSDRHKFPNFFRTIPSDIYQAWAIARLVLHFSWTWIGAVVASNNYGLTAIKIFQEEIQGAGVCLAFVETLNRENIVSDARRAALTIQASTARVVLIVAWYTDVRELFVQLAKINVTDRQFLASEAWSTSGDFLQSLVTSQVASGVVGVAIRSSTIPGFENYIRSLNPSHRPVDKFLREFWEKVFGCSPGATPLSSNASSPPSLASTLLQEASLPLCNGTESLEGVQNHFTDVSQLRVTYNVYLAVYAATGSPHCERCPSEFWSNVERTACIPSQLDFLSFNETLGITLTTAAVFGAAVTTAVFVVFLSYRQTPMVRANNSELSFLLLLSLKLCFLCSLVFIGRPSVWTCRLQQATFGMSFGLCVSCLQVKTIVVLAAFRSARPGAEALIRWFGPGQQRGSVCFLTCIQIIICVTWLSLSPPVPQRDLGFQGSKVTLECAMTSVVGFSLVLGYIGLLACTCLILAFLARKLPDNFNEAKLITFSMLIFCAVWVAFVPAYVSSPGKYTVAVEIFAILASSYGLLICIFAPKCFIILLRPERNTKKHLMAR
uniref:extracellular calcium-sensing receptor-like n=1 Tax=Monopterus albus TaxID=43700 RepID=UPI0009B470A8|nr:extracellular calcium-sensing receptor-like [Monopterus albus]